MEEEYIKRFLLTDRQLKKLSVPTINLRDIVLPDLRTSEETFKEQIKILKLYGYKINDLFSDLKEELR